MDPLTVKEQELSCSARKLLPSNSQWSFQHALFFARYNGLFYDYWQDTKHVLATLLSDMSLCQACWNESNRVNASISFPSKEYALLSEGAGRLLIFFTGDRSNCNTWKQLTKEAFVVVDSKICPGNNEGFQIDCALQCIQKIEGGDQKFLHSEVNVFTFARSPFKWLQVNRFPALNLNTLTQFYCFVDCLRNYLLCVLGIEWNSLIPTDQRGEYRKSLEVLEEICDRLEQFTSSEEVATKMEDYQQAFNTEQLEECDVPESQTAFLTWLDGNSHDILRQADIGGYPFLFSVKCDARMPPLFCLRHLVDGVLWQVSDHCWSHFATFNAFGYIQAGNANRKYYACATDCSYAYVAEEKKRVRLYWQPHKLNSVLTNRRTGEKVETRAVQQMVTLNNQEEIWGIVALPDFMFILTESRLIAVKVRESILPATG
ncbi:hypothetical protein TTRE_0000753101 [Trichuris trichiura]|uniref:Uncharacterized protein n=1 Tax=Trichuris trichiura TaxID=36087 RepID=A0A077ZFT5_TRITR|nr:hypothetical protein TTRE_0000753101 [Trichuris trichiura]